MRMVWELPRAIPPDCFREVKVAGITGFTRGRRESWERGRFEKDLAIEVLGRFPCPDLVLF